MKKVLTTCLVLFGCAPIIEFTDDELMPFRSAMAPDGSKTWTFVVTPMLKDYYPEKSSEQLLAEQIAANKFCENGYQIEDIREVNGSTRMSGSCR